MSNSSWAYRFTTAAVSAVLAGGALLSTAGTASAAAPATIAAAPTVATEWRWISSNGGETWCPYAVERAKIDHGWDAVCIKSYQVPGHPNAGHVWNLYVNVV